MNLGDSVYSARLNGELVCLESTTGSSVGSTNGSSRELVCTSMRN